MGSKYSLDFLKTWPDEQSSSVLNYSSPFGLEQLDVCLKTRKPLPLTLNEIFINSEEFPIKHPIETCRIKTQPLERWSTIEKQCAGAYPVIHERVLWLYIAFLEHKLNYGSSIEKEVYRNMSIIDFIDRLLLKRCVSFYGKNDKYLLISGESGVNCYGDQQGDKDAENEHFNLSNLLSYDEIKLSALMSITSPTEFINNGARYNKGIPEMDKKKIQQNGIIFGYTGARLIKKEKMEFQEILITRNQNTSTNGYGPKPEELKCQKLKQLFDYRNIWNRFYDEDSYLHDNIVEDGYRFMRSGAYGHDYIFDCVAMKKRYSISIDTLLLASEARAVSMKKLAYIHVVGIGLGTWRLEEHQEIIFLKVFEQRIKYLLSRLKNIRWIHFAWFDTKESGQLKDQNIINSVEHPEGVQIFMSKRNPADKLIGKEYNNSLLIASYASDGGALPGNEFWKGYLESSSDSSTASSTLITEIHNPHINKTMISGPNLHIVSPQYGLAHISDYAFMYSNDFVIVDK